MAAKRKSKNGGGEKVVGAQVSAVMGRQIEDFRRKMAKAFPGSQPTVSDAVRALLERGLAADGR